MRNRRQRHLSHSEVDSEGSWAISYGDMVTLLLTFFIIFFAADKFKMQKALNIDFMVKHAELRPIVTAALNQAMLPDEHVLADVQGQVYQVGQRIVVEFSGVSFFPSGKVELTTKAKKALKRFYASYSPYMGQYNIGIRAFTDRRKVTADKHRYRDNLELSALRSVSVMREFQQLGIPLDRMKLSGFGEMRADRRDPSRAPGAVEPTSTSIKEINDLARTTILVIEPKEAE